MMVGLRHRAVLSVAGRRVNRRAKGEEVGKVTVKRAAMSTAKPTKIFQVGNQSQNKEISSQFITPAASLIPLFREETTSRPAMSGGRQRRDPRCVSDA